MASKGRKKETLYDLSRLPVTKEVEGAILVDLITESDRSAAINGCAIVDSALVKAISSRFVEDDDFFESLFYSQTAPLQSFSSRIKIGYAIGLYGPQFRNTLNIIRNVRNAFAHTAVPLDFRHHLVINECKDLPAVLKAEVTITMDDGKSVEMKRKMTPWRERYVYNCFVCIAKLEERSNYYANKRITADFLD